jgi:hypothetical protein
MKKILKNLKKIFLKKEFDSFESSWMKGDLKTDFDFKKYSNHNIFNSLSANSNYGFYYWPYGYLFRHVKWGMINKLGFRTDIEFENFEQIKSQFQIGFFGGSTGYDVLVPYDQSIVGKLEKKLNNNKYIKEKYGLVKIINFSQPGNLVLNQIINFIQFGSLANLKIIISHSSGNDFGAGLSNDPKIVKKYKIAYLDVMEAWGKKIHDSYLDIDILHLDQNSQDFKTLNLKTDPLTAFNAYKFRIDQFAKLVTSQNKIFVNGVMPHIFSKKKLSQFEEKKLKNSNPYYKNVYEALPKVYEILNSDIKNNNSHYKIINFHEIFADLSPTKNHFGDFVHLLDEGNEVVSNEYYKSILEEILN